MAFCLSKPQKSGNAGEGTLGQLVALFGRNGTATLLRRLQMVWVSHSHADHHLGLPRLLRAATSARGAGAPPVLVVGPRVIGRWLEAYSALLPLGSRPLWSFESCAAFNAPRSCRPVASA